MTTVRTELAAYVAAAAELPRSLSLAPDDAGSVVAIAGRGGWPAAVLRAVERGAVAVVVDEPAWASPSELDVLAEVPVPVVLSRSRLRGDAAADARRADPAALIVGSGAAPAAELIAVVRDAVGWIRVLGGATVSPVSVGDGDAGAIALLDVGGVPATLAATVLDASAMSRIRATALGVERTEIEAAGEALSVRISGESGMRTLPVRFETPARLALRRAVEAVGGATDDVSAFRADARVADAVLAELRLPGPHKRDRSST